MSEDDVDDRPGDRRAETVPNANSPQLLTHLLEMVSRGVRSTRALQESLGVDQRTVRYYVQAGVWLGLLDDTSEPLLTAEGLAYVYAGPTRREVWSRALRAHPFVGALLEDSGGSPPTDAHLRSAIRAADPTLADSTVERRASALRGLLGPLFDGTRAGLDGDEPQLALPLHQAPRVEPEPPMTDVSGRSFSPDVYRWLLAFLLDHGELTLGHVRGLLDRAGATDVPIGGYVDLAVARGDAVRSDERLLATHQAVARRDLVATTAGVILSDGGWRAHLDAVRAAPPDEALRAGSGRYRPWDRRLLGGELDPGTVDLEIDRVLRDRRLQAWPRAIGPGTAPAPGDAPFLETWDQPGLLVTLPPSLAQLWEGVAGLNRRLRDARYRADAVGSPTIAYRPLVAHGGPLHPGEPLPRSVPDTRTLRQRLTLHAPYVGMTLALLHAHRADHPAIEVRHDDGGWVVVRHRRPLGPLLDVLDQFGKARGWIVCRRTRGGLAGDVLVGLLERLGLAVVVQRRLVLDDAFFLRLRNDDEEALLAPGLIALGDAMVTWIASLPSTERR